MVKICEVEGCGQKHAAKGLCRAHYAKTRHPVYYAKNKERIAQYGAAWRRVNVEKVRSAERRRNALDPAKEFRRRRKLAQIFSKARASALHRNLTWELTVEELSYLRSLPCQYCAGPLPPTGSGLDRKDNAAGYTKGNVVPCCTDCNRTRGDRFSYAEMLELGVLIRTIKHRRDIQAVLTYTNAEAL